MIPFIVASLGIAWLSRASLRNFRSHGFYRFFALEAILLLVWLNGEFWFYVPFSVHQIISWVLLGISLFLADSVAGLGVVLNAPRRLPQARRYQHRDFGLDHLLIDVSEQETQNRN